ncbi:hypothetical protein DFH29DRAFT_890397 [Suillus ampliporus]|nr:hypothetical protein DFH29DRAFT_890397 [Suillus ampliporus]
MDPEFNSRPLSILHRTRQSHDHASTHSPPSSPVPPPSSFTLASLTQRRRSSAANFPPAGPPPSQPIPSLPLASTSAPYHPDDEPPSHITEELSYATRHRSSTSGSQSNYGRPSASANLAAIAAFQTRQASTSASNSPQPSSSTVAHDFGVLSDPSPRSALQPTSSSHHQDIVPDRLLLSPTQSRNPSQSRPSSRRALTRALELAREAVQLDSTNDDPHAAVMAYGRSVALLSEVMERVRRGEDSTERPRRNGRRRSVVAQEEEVRRLKSIHDTYADRMNILSLIYSIPPIPHSPSSVYAPSTSTDSTQPPSPSSLSPTSDSHRISSYPTEHTQDDPQHVGVHNHNRDDDNDGHEGIGAALLNASYLTTEFGQRTNGISLQHPYAVPVSPLPPPPSSPQDNSTTPLNRTATLPANRTQYTPSVTGRPRAASVFPPAAPPPALSPPPPPLDSAVPAISATMPSQTSRFLETTRPRGNSVGHRRTGSGTRLTSVTEEGMRLDGPPTQESIDDEDVTASLPRRPDTPRTAIRDSHPLPPLPSPTATSYSVRSPESPVPQAITPRVRGESMSMTSGQQLINTSLAMGTIHQRRTKMSAPPSTGSPSPTESPSPSAFSLPAQKPTGVMPLVVGRSRASSQPGRRPSVGNGHISPFDSQRPPLPHTAGLNGLIPRKMSNPSKLQQNISINIPQLPQLMVQTELLSPPPALTLVPPPALISNLPTTPTSPLPPAPPADSQRKPYHMMTLLANTMTSRSGGYITRRLHVPQEVWSQGGAKLANIPEKVRVVEVLCSALEEMQQCSVESFGASVCSGLALGIGSVTRKEAETWVGKLEEFSLICDSVVANFGKKLGVGEGFVVKKSGGVTSWGGKLTRQIDKFTNGKNLDSPAAYVSGLNRLFTQAQLIDEHTKALLSQPVAATYAAFPIDLRAAAEVKLKRASEFFASVVLTFVIRDLAQLLDKYAKKCEKWLAE